jgi:ribosomal protein L13
LLLTQEDQVTFKIKNVADCLPKFTIERAVKGMLSETEKEINATIKNFNDQNHSHQAQNPITIDVDNFRSNPSFNAELSELN